jgi:hypothetical protein
MTTPAVRLPGAFAIPSVAPVYIDGIPAQKIIPTPIPKVSGQDFWSSPVRPAGDPHVEQLTVSLGQARLVNYVSLDVAHFPHTLQAYWWNGATWSPLMANPGTPFRIITTGSVPAVVDNPAARGVGLNPWHYGAGHWVHHDESVVPVTTTRLLLRLKRLARTGSQSFPVNPQRKFVAYPLGVRSMDFGSRMLSSPDVPATPRDPVTLSQRQPFTTTVDVNGSPVQVALRENRACDLLRGEVWRCAPQPHTDAVVNLYLDGRDSAGNAQLIDRFYVNPVTSGVRFNLYYAPLPPPAGAPFAGLDDPLLPELIVADGTTFPAISASGIVFTDQPGWLTLANQSAGTSAGEPWWAGIEIMPGFGSDDEGTYVVADAGVLQLAYVSGTWQVTIPAADPAGGPSNIPSGAVLGSWAFEFAAGDRLQFVAGYDGASFFAWSPQATMYLAPAQGEVPPAPEFRFGGLLDQDPSGQALAGNYTLTAFVLKQEVISATTGTPAQIPAAFAAFAADATGYVYPPLAAESATTDNAVIRFSPQYLLGGTCPWGFVGGLGQAYTACSWIPVQRDYQLARGYVEFDPVLASAWKFEFTSLRAEPYEYMKTQGVTAIFMPPASRPGPQAVSPTTPAVLDAGLAVNQDVAPSVNFSDAPARSPAPDPDQPPATEALFATQPEGIGVLADQGGALLNFQPWQSPAVVPRQAAAGTHAYRSAEVKLSSRVAYFVAVSELEMYRIDYTASDDTEMYLETFSDAAFIDESTLTPGGWELVPGTGLTAPAGMDGAPQVQSRVLNSLHGVTGVQFATVQSDPVQLLGDPDFSQPGFAGWIPVGDALPLEPSQVSSQLGSMVAVSRGQGSPSQDTVFQPASWAWLESTYASWTDVEDQFPSWLDFGLPPVTSAMGGIAYAGAPAATTAAGRVYVAARVFSPVALSAPLYLQLLDGATGAVIAEEEQQVAGGTVTEWFTGFTLGTGELSTNTWAEEETAFPTWASIATAAPTWDEMDTSVIPLGSTVTVRLIQKDSTSDTWDVDNISVFEDALVWEFSNDGGQSWYPAYDIRNNPRGALTFPPPDPGQGAQLRWRVTAYRPGVSVSALAVRPWYVTWPHGIIPRPSGVGHGPNLAPQDQYTAVEGDPRWQMSSSPVPEAWFFRVRQAIGLQNPAGDFPGPALPPPDASLGSALVWQPPVPAAPGPQTWTDIYSDIYTETYALADGGDIYTDTYCDTYGDDYPAATGTTFSGAAALTAGFGLAAAGLSVPAPASDLGVDLGPVPGSDPSIAAWAAATGEPVPVRRYALGNAIPASLAGSPFAADAAAGRRVLIDFRPDATTTPQRLTAFLNSCQDGGLDCAVSVWAGPDKSFGSPAAYFAVLPDYVTAIHGAGYEHVFTIDNASVTHNALAAWYPGDGLVDVIMPYFWCTGPAPGSGGDTLALAGSFADAHGKPLGLAGFGVDRSKYTTAQGQAFLNYVLTFFAARLTARKINADLIYLGTGSYSLVGTSQASRVATLVGFDVAKGAWASANNQIGPGQTHRLFYSGALPAAFDADGTPSSVTIVVSYKTQNTNVASYISSIPAGRQVVMIYHHEPENDYSSGATFVSEFKAQSTLIRAHAGSNVKIAMCAESYKYGSGRSADAAAGNYLRGLGSFVDYFTLDIYQGQDGTGPAGSWNWTSKGLANDSEWLTWISLVTSTSIVGTVKPLGITEYGIFDPVGNAARNARLQVDAAFLTATFPPGGGAVSPHPLAMFMYWWETNTSPDSQFVDAATIATWQGIERGSGSGGLLAVYQQIAVAL